ncbi:MAG: MFS transporter [Solirubrobacterales bacterium]|nr:MFS transporter [Solirubrobacterales bacterium]
MAGVNMFGQRRPLPHRFNAAQTGALIAVSLAMFCIQVDFFALNLVLPSMARGFRVGADDVQWSVSAYMLSLGSLFILGGRLGDIYGRRAALLAGIAAFGAASIGCAIAPSLPALVLFRVLQGAGAALVFPVGIAVLSNAYPDEQRAHALGLLFAIANVGTALGPFAGGGLASGPGWRWIFWSLAVLCAGAFAVAMATVSDSRDPSAERRLDVLGAALVSASVAAVSIAADRGDTWGWGNARTIGCFALAALLLAAFIARERRTAAPLVDLSLFRNLPYVLVTAMGAMSNIAYVVTVFAASLYLQRVRGLSALTAGLVFVGPSLLVALSGPLGARLGRYFRPTAVMAMAGVVAGSALFVLTFTPHGLPYVLVFSVAGLGFGLGWTFVNISTQDLVAKERAGEASGVVLTIVVTAGGIGVAAAATAISLLEHGGTPANAIDSTLRVIAGALIAAAVIVMAIRRQLVRRGLMAPLSMKQPWPPPAPS